MATAEDRTTEAANLIRSIEWRLNAALENAPPHLIPDLCAARFEAKRLHEVGAIALENQEITEPRWDDVALPPAPMPPMNEAGGK